MAEERPLEQVLKELSPEDLRLYKQNLVLRSKSWAPEELESVFQRIKGIPELSDLTGTIRPLVPSQQVREQAPTVSATEQLPLWQKGLHYAFWPFQQIQEKVIDPFAAIVSSPFSPTVEGAENLPWLQREMAEYQKWQAPWGVKFALETAPWFMIPTGAGLVGRLGSMAAKGGRFAELAEAGAQALKPIALYERAITYPIAKPIQMIAGKVAPKSVSRMAAEYRTATEGKLLTDLQQVDEAIAIATQPSFFRSLANISVGGKRPLSGIAKAIAGRAAVANNPAELALVARDILRFEAVNKTITSISTLERLGSSRKLFDLGDDMIIRSGPFKGTHIETLRTYPKKYSSQLTTEQNAWLEQSSLLEREKRELFRRYDIEIKDLVFEEGGEYAGRRVFGKLDSQGSLTDFAYIGAGQPARPGAKTAAEKVRVFATAEEATANGFRYLAPEEALYYNITGAYNRIADKQWTEWFLTKVPYRTVAVQGTTAVARAEMLEVQSALKQMTNIVQRLKNRESVPGQMLKGIKEYYPKEYEQIRLMMAQSTKYKPSILDKEALDSLETFIFQQKKFYAREWQDTLKYFREARQSAIRPGFTGTMAPDIPAFAGKVFKSAEAKEYINIIRKELNPNFNRALGSMNQLNAVGRYFALAGDISPGLIQLIFLAGAHPTIYARAMGGFVRSMFEPQYLSNFLAKHAKTIQSHPSLILSRGGVEFTEAMARGGLLRRRPFKMGGKVLEPFMRGYETAIDTAGVYMAETYSHLATTPARIAQIDSFINEFRGLVSTKRLGISVGQRQIENALMLAPQYNRAIAALMVDIARGGIRGQLARDAVAKGVAAIMSMTVAISYAMGDTEEEMRDRLNPLSPNFVTWEVGGQKVGPGSKVRSLLYTFGKMTKNPDDSAYYAGQFMRGNFAPFLGTSVDLITGKNYVGDPTRDGLLSLTKTVVFENLTPLWLQSAAIEGGDLQGSIVNGLVQFAGGRAYPIGAYGELKAKQDEIAKEKYGMSWDELGASPEHGKLYQIRLMKESEELKKLQETAEIESQKWARGETLVWDEYNKKLDHISQTVNKELNLASSQFESTGNGSRFRDRVNRAFFMKSEMRRALLEEERFGIVKEYYDSAPDSETMKTMSPQDLAYREYNEVMYAPDMYDEFGEYRFDEADKRRQELVQRYGLDVMNYIEQMIGERRADEPLALQRLRQAREILRPYWELEDRVWNNYPPDARQLAQEISKLEQTNPELARMYLKAHPIILYARRLIAQYRKIMRQQYPEIDYALKTFYS